jgi:hypothetical protein
MIITKKAIPRRTFLRGAGAALALPMLDSMVPAMASTLEPGSPARLSFLYVPNGIIMDRWTPAAEGAGFPLTPILEPLEPFRDCLLVLSGLAQDMGLAWEGEGGGDHARASAVFLTCAHPKKTEGSGIHAGMSIDQIAAKELGRQTQVASLELALDFNEVVGTCDLGYSCAYSNTLCWRSATTPVPMENLPRSVFERLFGDSSSTKASDRLARIREDRSILDFVNESVGRLLTRLGPADRNKLSEYLDAVRDIERRIQLAEEQSARELPAVERPAGVPATFEEHAKLMFDLLVLAYQSDTTRIGTFMLGREQNTRVYSELGISDAYHPLTHHQGDRVKIDKVTQIDILHTKAVAYFLEKLRSTPDGDGTLLDHSMIVYGSSMSDGNMHVHHDVPVFMVAGKSSQIKGGRHLRYPQHTPMANLYLSMLDRAGIHLDNFGDSTGRLDL